MSDPIARPTPLADLVAYQPGSVVSRVLLKNAGGVLTVFAFAEGEGLAEHSTPHDATIHVLEGSVRITVGDDNMDVTTGMIVHLPAGIPHTLHGGGPFKMLLVMLRSAPAS